MLRDFDLLSLYRTLMGRWTWLLAGGLLAGSLGLLAHSARPPVYEATAILGIGLDRVRGEIPDDITVRQAYDRVRVLLLADDTLDRVGSRLSGTGADPAHAEARAELRRRLRLAEGPEGWELVVQGSSPAEVEGIAQAWAEVALEELHAAAEHALRAGEWQNTLFEASCRLIADGDDPGSAVWLCRSDFPVETAATIPEALIAEVEASRGILPVLTYSLLQSAEGTARQILWDRGLLTLAGSAAGVVVGALVAWWRRSPPSG